LIENWRSSCLIHTRRIRRVFNDHSRYRTLVIGTVGIAMARLISIGIFLGISTLLLGKLVVAAENEWRSAPSNSSPAVEFIRQR